MKHFLCGGYNSTGHGLFKDSINYINCNSSKGQVFCKRIRNANTYNSPSTNYFCSLQNGDIHNHLLTCDLCFAMFLLYFIPLVRAPRLVVSCLLIAILLPHWPAVSPALFVSIWCLFGQSMVPFSSIIIRMGDRNQGMFCRLINFCQYFYPFASVCALNVVAFDWWIDCFIIFKWDNFNTRRISCTPLRSTKALTKEIVMEWLMKYPDEMNAIRLADGIFDLTIKLAKSNQLKFGLAVKDSGE